MANKKITDLSALVGPSSGDLLAVVDISDTSEAASGTTKKIAVSDLVTGGVVPDDSVTNAKLANMAQATIKGRASGAGTGDPTDLTGTQATAILDNFVGDSGAGGTKGLVPAPATGDAPKFLKGDGTWATPTGTGIGGSTGATDNALLRADGTGGSTVQASAVTVDDNGAVTIPEISAPGTPAAGKVVIYAKSDNKVYRKGEDGVEAELGGGGGTTINSTDNLIPFRSNSTTFGNSLLTHDAGNGQTTTSGHIMLNSNTNKVLGWGTSTIVAGLAYSGQGAVKVVKNSAGDAGTILSNFLAPPEPGGNPAPWASEGMNFRRVLTGNITVGAPGNTGGDGTAPSGYRFILMLVQDGTGSRTAAWHADFNFPGGTTPTLTTTANAVDIFEFICFGDQAYCIGQWLDVK